MLIIEGPDLVGKTTLALALQKELANRRYCHIYSHFTRLPATFDQYWDYLPHIRADVVQDRFHMSRQAYGRQFHEQKLMSSEELRLIDSKLRQVGAMTVVCVSTSDTFLEQQYLKKDRDEMYKLDGILGVNAKYRNIIDTREMDFDIVVDASKNWPTSYLNAILHLYLCRRKEIHELQQRKAPALRVQVDDHDPVSR